MKPEQSAVNTIKHLFLLKGESAQIKFMGGS